MSLAPRRSQDRRGWGESSTHIKCVDATLVNEEALEETLDYDQALPQDEDHGVDPGPPAVENGEECILGQEGKGEEDEVDDEGDEQQRQQPPGEEGPELAVAQEIPDAADGIGGCDASALEVIEGARPGLVWARAQASVQGAGFVHEAVSRHVSRFEGERGGGTFYEHRICVSSEAGGEVQSSEVTA